MWRHNLFLQMKKLDYCQKNGVFWMLRRVAFARTDVSEELSAYIIRVTRIGEVGTLAVTSNRRRFLQEPHGVQTTKFFIVTAVKTSNLT
jgi:hypothetical protein